MPVSYTPMGCDAEQNRDDGHGVAHAPAIDATAAACKCRGVGSLRALQKASCRWCDRQLGVPNRGAKTGANFLKSALSVVDQMTFQWVGRHISSRAAERQAPRCRPRLATRLTMAWTPRIGCGHAQPFMSRPALHIDRPALEQLHMRLLGQLASKSCNAARPDVSAD
jgi:hypothetical protein